MMQPISQKRINAESMHIVAVLDGDSDNFRFKKKANSFGRIFRYMK